MEGHISIDTKLKVLSRMGKRFNEENITWAVGASLLLYLQGIAENFHDIDIMVSEADALHMKEILLHMGREQEANSGKNFQSKYFWKFLVDEVEIDVMGGLGILKDGRMYYCPLKEEEITDEVMLNEVEIPLHSVEHWRHLYELMGRTVKVEMIDSKIGKGKCTQEVQHAVLHNERGF